MAQEELNAPQSVTGQRLCHFGSHALRFGQMLRSDACRLEAFAVVAPFLYMSDGRTKQRRPVFLGNGKQSYLTVELNEFLHDQFFDIPTASMASVVPGILQVFRPLRNRLAFS